MSGDEGENPMEMPRSQLLTLTLAFEGGLLILGVLLGYFLGQRFWEGEAVTFRGLGLGTLGSLPLLVLVIGLCESSWGWGEQIRRDFEPITALFKHSTILDIAFISFMAGLCEEVFFRGFGQNYLVEFVGLVPALIVASLIFGALHWISFSYFVFASVIGGYLGVLYVWSGSLVVPITTHAVYDFVALVYATRFRGTD